MAMQPPPLTVYQWGPDWNLPSMDGKCLSVQAYLRFASLSVRIVDANRPSMSPVGELPFLRDEGDNAAVDVVGFLRKKGFDLDRQLSQAQMADAAAFKSLIEDRFYLCVLRQFFLVKKNYEEVVRVAYSAATPFPLNYVLPRRQRKDALERTKHMHFDDDEDVERVLRECLGALSARLGDKTFFFGDIPTSLDAVVYGHLSVAFSAPLPSGLLTAIIREHGNLMEFLVRIHERFFPEVREGGEWDDEDDERAAGEMQSPYRTPGKVRRTPGRPAAASTPSRTPGRNPGDIPYPRTPFEKVKQEREKREAEERARNTGLWVGGALAAIIVYVYFSGVVVLDWGEGEEDLEDDIF